MENNPIVQKQIEACLEVLKKIFRKDLLAIYLYGSFLTGGVQKFSDVDLLVLINRPSSVKEKLKLIDKLLHISGIYMKSTKSPIDLTVVVKKSINPWNYPPKVDFQYGEWLRETFEIENFKPENSSEMPDLALLITQVLLKSRTILGPEPGELLAAIPHSDFINAMLHDLDRLYIDLMDDTRNVLLTYARIWSTLETNQISSKPEAADWAIQRLPKSLQPVLNRAKMICVGLENEFWDDLSEHLKPCVQLMLSEIHELKLSLNLEDPTRIISLSK
ncbi:MAG: DUF4111 domain-containing protein [Tatlockia sp.]|nr:DUF4111 domain-containing protein [Tatlockia sp.]